MGVIFQGPGPEPRPPGSCPARVNICSPAGGGGIIVRPHLPARKVSDFKLVW